MQLERRARLTADEAIFGFNANEKRVPGLLEQMAVVNSRLALAGLIDSWLLRIIAIAILAHILGWDNALKLLGVHP